MEIDVKSTLLPLAIFLAMVGIGVELQWHQFRALAQKPRVPVLGTLVHTLSFPIVSIGLVGLARSFSWPISDALMVGILLVAACPSGGFSNILTSLAKGDLALSVALTTISSLLSFATVPILIFAFAQILPAVSGTVEIPIGSTLLQLVVLVVLPVAVGMSWRNRQPDYVERHLGRIQGQTQIFAYVVILMVIYQQWDQVKNQIASALPWAFFLCIVGIAVGYLLARSVRLSPVDAVTVAIEGSIRNLTVSFLIATTVLRRFDIAVFSMVYFAAVLVVGISFALAWRRWGPRTDAAPACSSHCL